MTNLSELAQPWAMHNPQNNRLPINPNHPFYYRHWPANWEFGSMIKADVKGKKSKLNHVFFPSVDIERVVPGVNGVHQIQGEIGDPSSRLGKLRQKGFVILDPNDHDYMRVYPAKFGGKHHAPKWQTFRVLAGQIISKFDMESWNLWRIELITQGLIEIPHEHFMELSIITARRYPERLIPSQHLPEVKKKLDSAYAKIKIMETTMNSIIKNGLSYYEGLLDE